MSLSHEQVGPKILGKIKIYVLSRAELLFFLFHPLPKAPRGVQNCEKIANVLNGWSLSLLGYPVNLTYRVSHSKE